MQIKTAALLVLLSSMLVACFPYDNNNYGYGYSNDRYRYDNYDYRYDQREERLREERERLREERERLERERERNTNYQKPTNRPAVVVDKCPRGFYPRASKCSKRERKRGCKDTRSSTGARYCVAGV